jgi:hypothetical protein
VFEWKSTFRGTHQLRVGVDRVVKEQKARRVGVPLWCEYLYLVWHFQGRF